MFGLTRMPASGASLLLNAEGVFTALLAWFVFRENFDRRIAVGMVLIVAGATVLSWPGEARFAGLWPALPIAVYIKDGETFISTMRPSALADFYPDSEIEDIAAAVERTVLEIVNEAK
jgi:drug/metabolite transporter (DMT)-like permease